MKNTKTQATTQKKPQPTASTIARTVFLALALLNSTLTAAGINPLPFSDDELYEFASAAVTTVAAIIAWWENNSFTEYAILADENYTTMKYGRVISTVNENYMKGIFFDD